MDADLKCNNLSCRKTFVDKAVVTTCSHIFCVECANELFTATQLCPACETHLTEPDDVVIASLHPSNDYKTSVLSGLGPGLILEICGRAMSFWQYQIQQENSFQQAVVKNMNERNAQLQKQLDSVVREANGELSLLNNKVQGLEKELELERRKVRDMQDSAREKDKEYQKLKNHFDKIKRKALLVPNSLTNEGFAVPTPVNNEAQNGSIFDRHNNKGRGSMFTNTGAVNAIVNGMEANGVQRTPLRGSGANGSGVIAGHIVPDWQPLGRHDPAVSNHGMNHYIGSTSERSVSAEEVENMLGSSRQVNRQYISRPINNVAQYNGRMMSSQHAGALQTNTIQRPKGFRPSIPL